MATDNTQVFIKESYHQIWTLMPAPRPGRQRGENGLWAEHRGAPPQPDGVQPAK